MWIPRLLLGLLVVYSVGRVRGQPPVYTTRPDIGIPNLNRVKLVPGSFLSAVIAVVVGYTSNILIDPTSGDPIKKCPEGWFKRLGRCYFFSETKASWYGAEAQCRIMGSYLAIPDTEAENDILKELSRSEQLRISPNLDHIPHFARWIGLHTVDGTTITKIISKDIPTFTNFVNPEPQSLSTQMCVKLEDDSDFTWATQQCFRTFFYICERNLKVPFTYNI